MDKHELIKNWFKKGSNDLVNIENNLRGKNIPTDTVCFHSQQAIEKYIKGAFVFYDKTIYKSHDLIKLFNDIKEEIPELLKFRNELEELSLYGVEVRYPDNYYEPSLEEAKLAYENAKIIIDIIKNKIKIV